MNLGFKTMGKVTKDGIPYYIQSADVTGNGRFWSEWKHAKQARADAERLNSENGPDLTSSIRLQREIIDGSIHWVAYRLLPVDGTLKPLPFRESFVLRDVRGLLPYQSCAVYHLCNAIINHGAAADGSDTGLGKTYHALGVCRNLLLHPAIICRKPGIAGWNRACKTMNIEPVFITNWEQAKNGKFRFAEKRITGRGYRYRWILPQNSLLIFDEAHMGAVDGTQNNLLWLAAKGIAHLSLSATFSDRASRLKSLLWLLGVVSSKEDYERWLMERGTYTNRFDEIESLDDMGDLLEINKVLYPRHGYRLSYNDPEVKKYFPKAVYQTEIITLSKKSTEEQNELYRELLEKVEYYKSLGNQAEVLNADMRYRQATELLKAPVVADIAANLISQGSSVCVFVNYRETLAWFMRIFKTKSAIFGDQERYGIDREQVRSDFQNDKQRIIFCMAQAGGQSIDLHDIRGQYPRVSLVFPTYDPIVLKQVLGRTYRAGARSMPVMKLVYAAGTVEEKVADSVNRKIRNISALNDGDLMEPDLFNMGA